MPTITAPDGASLFYEVSGRGPSDLIFLHGVPGTGLIWRGVVDSLEPAAFRSIVVDLRGHGRSKPGKGPVDFGRIHQDLLLIADAVQSLSAWIVGHSGSGKNALWLAANAPARVKGLVLVAPTGCRTLPIPREAVTALLKASRDREQMHVLVSQWFRLGTGPDYEAYLRSLEDIQPEVLGQTMAMWGEVSVEVQARAVRQPVLLLVGGEDRIYPEDFLRKDLMALIPTSCLASMQAGHLIPLEDPVQLARRISGFCRRSA